MKIATQVILGLNFSLVAFLGLHERANAANYDIPALASASLDDRTHAQIMSDGITATLKVTPSRQCGARMVWQNVDPQAPASCQVAYLTIKDLAHPSSPDVSFALSPYGSYGPVNHLTMSMYHLDTSSSAPQIMVSAYTGGAHCCEITSIFGLAADGAWKETLVGSYDGGSPPEVIDAAHNGSAEIVTFDQSFLYTFSSHAGSYPPVILEKYQGGILKNVTKDSVYKSYLQQQLEESQNNWIQYGKSEPNGFLAYYVATKANLGQFSEAWNYMLANMDLQKDSMFGVSLCDFKPGNHKECTRDEQSPLPFPMGLALFLEKNGYITDDQAKSVPLVPSIQSVSENTAGHYNPDFSCTPPPEHNGVAVMLCENSLAAKHELEFDQVYYALRQVVGKDGWKLLKQEVILDENAANASCGLPIPGATDQSIPSNGAACYIGAMDSLAEKYRRRLSGAALEEASRPIDTHIALQKKLIDLGYLPAGSTADGVYGESTRIAIGTWQRVAGRPEVNSFISNADADALLPATSAAPTPTPSVPAPNAAPSISTIPTPAPAPSVQNHAKPSQLFGLAIWIVVLVIIFGFTLYFLPFAIACIRDTTKKGAVFAVNFFFGWTLIGWVAALVMAISFETQSDYELKQKALSKIVNG